MMAVRHRGRQSSCIGVASSFETTERDRGNSLARRHRSTPQDRRARHRLGIALDAFARPRPTSRPMESRSRQVPHGARLGRPRPQKPRAWRGYRPRCPRRQVLGVGSGSGGSVIAAARSAARRRPRSGHRTVDGQHRGLRGDDAARLVGPRVDGRIDGPALGRRPSETLPICSASSASPSWTSARRDEAHQRLAADVSRSGVDGTSTITRRPRWSVCPTPRRSCRGTRTPAPASRGPPPCRPSSSGSWP